MTSYLRNIDFQTSEAASAARARSAGPIVNTTPGLDVSTALFCIGSFDGLATEEELLALESEENSKPLMAAARTLVSISEELRQQNEEYFDVPDALLIHAAVAFAMYGNFPSARSSVLKVKFSYRIATPARRLAWAICDPEAIETLIERSTLTEELRFYRSWKTALSTVTDDACNVAGAILEGFVISPSVSDTALLLSSEVAFRQGFRLAIAHLKKLPIPLPIEFLDRLLESGRWTLLPPQRKLLVEKNLIQSKENTLLNLPTSTGKTLLAESCLAAGIANTGGISVFIAPYVAIGEQVLTALGSHMPADVQIVSMFGGFKDQFPTSYTDQKQIIVATPERFDGWLRNSKHISLLRVIVFDELHCIENGPRGARLEGIVSRLRLMQKSGSNFRLVCLSAVLPDAIGLQKWLSVPDDQFHRESWRPTTRRLAICRADGNINWIYGGDPLRPQTAHFGSALSIGTKIKLPENIRPFRGQYVPDKDALAQSRNIAAISMDLARRMPGPGLIVCPRRIDTKRLASAIAAYEPKIKGSSDRLSELAQRIETQYPWLTELARAVEAGVAYHNSTLPFDVRRWIEQSLREGDILFVAATTTLAEGADLPFRWTLISHWLKGIYIGAKPLNPLIFRNIAGRSGRAGSYSEGDTILFESLLGPATPQLSSEQNRIDAITYILTDNSPLTSAANALKTEIDQRQVDSVAAAYTSQLLASIHENPDSDDIINELTYSSYASFSGDADGLAQLYKKSLEQILDPNATGGAMAVQNSPVKLTPLGQAANLTGFSPSSVRKILNFLMQNLEMEDHELVAAALNEFAELPEQSNSYLIKTCRSDSHRQLLKKEDLPSTVLFWMSGLTIRDIFETLPTYKKTKSKRETIESDFDNFVNFTDSVFRSFLPWLVRCMNSLKDFGSSSAQLVDWNRISSALERRELEQQ